MMFDEWIKMRKNLLSEIEVGRLTDLLGIHEDEVVGKLHKFWSWCDTNTTDGNLIGVTNVTVDRYMNAPNFCKCMAEVGWLVIEKDRLLIPNFGKHNSESAKKRAKTREKVRKWRNQNVTSGRLRSGNQKEKEKEKIRDASASLSGMPENGQPDEPKPERKPRQPNPTWDAVAAIWFGGKVIRSQTARVGRIVRDLNELGATPDEIRDRHQRQRDEWGDNGATPEALVKHWHAFGVDRKPPANGAGMFGGVDPSPARIRAPAGKYDHIVPANKRTVRDNANSGTPSPAAEQGS